MLPVCVSINDAYCLMEKFERLSLHCTFKPETSPDLTESCERRSSSNLALSKVDSKRFSGGARQIQDTSGLHSWHGPKQSGGSGGDQQELGQDWSCICETETDWTWNIKLYGTWTSPAQVLYYCQRRWEKVIASQLKFLLNCWHYSGFAAAFVPELLIMSWRKSGWDSLCCYLSNVFLSLFT